MDRTETRDKGQMAVWSAAGSAETQERSARGWDWDRNWPEFRVRHLPSSPRKNKNWGCKKASQVRPVKFPAQLPRAGIWTIPFYPGSYS